LGVCQNVPASNGTVCRAATGPCDVPETCVDGLCPVDTFHENGTVCSTNQCAIESCQDGSCVVDGFVSCDDSDPCTIDACDSEIGCTHEQVPDCP
jgi:hypothetical protein